MSNSKNDGMHELEKENIFIMGNAPVPHGGYSLIFSDELAAQISEFTTTPLFKELKRNYALQKKDLIARQALQSANTAEQLAWFKGMATSVSLFFTDMESVHKVIKKADDESEDSDSEE